MADAVVPDETLIAEVRAVLDPGPLAPSPASVYSLRLAVLERWGALDPAPARARRWPRRGAVVATVTTALTLGGGTVAFARPELPRQLRDAARMAGLPVGPAPEPRVRIERAELQQSLEFGDVTRIGSDLQDLERAETKLTPTERAGVRAADEDLERKARVVIGGQPSPSPERDGSGENPAPAAPEPAEARSPADRDRGEAPANSQAEPGATQPGATQPVATEPGATQPGATEPGATDSQPPSPAPAPGSGSGDDRATSSIAAPVPTAQPDAPTTSQPQRSGDASATAVVGSEPMATTTTLDR